MSLLGHIIPCGQEAQILQFLAGLLTTIWVSSPYTTITTFLSKLKDRKPK